MKKSQIKLPEFIVIGVAKAGTTSLAYYLGQHPEIYIPKEKETDFFHYDPFYSKGVNFYLTTFFSKGENYKIRGEATPAYIREHEKVIPRILETYQEEPPKLLVILRDPVKRAWSHYLHMVRLGREDLSFEDALIAEENRRKTFSWYCYFAEGLYDQLLEPWLQTFGKKRLWIMTLDELKQDLEESMRQVFTFVGADPSIKIQDKTPRNVASVRRSAMLSRLLTGHFWGARVFSAMLPPLLKKKTVECLRELNARPAKQGELPELDGKIMIELRQKYEQSLLRLEKMLGRSFAAWRHGNSGTCQ